MTAAKEHCPELYCVVCGKKFNVHAYRLAKAFTCSVKCSCVRKGWQSAVKRGTATVTPYRKFRGKRIHRIMGERIAGRPLRANEVVHHVDGNKRNNCISNLKVMTRKHHNELHNQKKSN